MHWYYEAGKRLNIKVKYKLVPDGLVPHTQFLMWTQVLYDTLKSIACLIPYCHYSRKFIPVVMQIPRRKTTGASVLHLARQHNDFSNQKW